MQAIDPDDLAAHYILSIVYRRLGMPEEASREAAAFSDQKDDPTANVYALDFLRKHPEVTAGERSVACAPRPVGRKCRSWRGRISMSRWLAGLFLAAGTLAFGSSANQRERGAADFSNSGCLHCHAMHNAGETRGPIFPE